MLLDHVGYLQQRFRGVVRQEKLEWSRTGKQSLGAVTLVVEVVGKGTDKGFPKGF